MNDLQIATVRKNSREHFRIAIREFRGVRTVDLRVYALDTRGNPIATPKGIAVRPDLLDELIGALEAARSKARALGAVRPLRPQYVTAGWGGRPMKPPAANTCADPHLRAHPEPRPLWSGPGEVGSHRLYGQLVEHLAGVEAASARAELA
jgi:hypothetical protein